LNRFETVDKTFAQLLAKLFAQLLALEFRHVFAYADGWDDQGDMIGQIFDFWAIVYFGRLFTLGSFLKTAEASKIFGLLFSTAIVMH
jgi:hypothetical protein